MVEKFCVHFENHMEHTGLNIIRWKSTELYVVKSDNIYD
jgi:hypothetical protein